VSARSLAGDSDESIEERFEDDPERLDALSHWRAEREAWLELERPARSAAGLFERLYELHGHLEREPERLELLVADGLLIWDTPAGVIRHPILLQRVQLEFAPEVPEFTIVETDYSPDLYDALFRGLPDVDGRVIRKALDEVESAGIHPLDTTATSGFLRSLVIRLSPHGELVEEGPPPAPGPDPRIIRDPVLFLRTRSLGFSRLLTDLLEDVDQRDDFSTALLSIVGDHSLAMSEATEQPAGAVQASLVLPMSVHQDDRILFSKPANQEQLRIARRLEQHGCVLVQGPPGTGKTHTIANLVGHLLSQGKSVLITSHTDKALRVVRQQVVEQLQPLCVSVLASENDSREQLKQSVTSILDRLSQDDADKLDVRVGELAQRRTTLLDELTVLDRQLQQARTDEYRDVVVAGEAYPPSDAARLVARGVEADSWLPAPVTLGAPLPLAAAEVQRLYALNVATSTEAESELAGWLPNLAALPTPETFSELASQWERLASAAAPVDRELWDTQSAEPATDELETLADLCVRAAEPLTGAPAWALAMVDAGRRGGMYREPWDNLIELVEKVQHQVAAAREQFYEHGPDLNSPLPLADQERLLREIVDHLEQGRQLNWLVLNFQHREWKDFLPSLRVGGEMPRRMEQFRALLTLACVLEARRRLVDRWRRQVAELDGPPPEQLGAEPEQACGQYVSWMRWALDWQAESWGPLEKQLRQWGLRWERVVERVPPRPGAYGPILRIRDAIQEKLVPTLAARADQLRRDEIEHQREHFAWLLTPPEDAKPALARRQLVVQTTPVAAIRDAHERVPSQPAPHSPSSRTRDAILARLATVLAARADQLGEHVVECQHENPSLLLVSPGNPDPAPVTRQLQAAVQANDVATYRDAYDRLRYLHQQCELLAERIAILARLERHAPAWAKAIRERKPGHQEPAPPEDVVAAWRWRQLHDELDRRARVSLFELERQRTRAQANLQRVTAELIECRAWAAQLRRVQGAQKQALVGWSKAVAKIGKGTGKYAAIYRAEAQRLMAECRDAVPVWIMSLARVVDNFDPRRTRFDVVIIDEASQSDVMGLLAVYLGQDVVIVGDDEQVSPDAVGLDLSQVQPLIDTYLTDIPLARLYDGQTSIYDLAMAAFGGTIMLREHFRCVPEIIQFSNRLSYKGQILPLRDPSNVVTKPYVVAHRVEGSATSRNVNEEEAQQIAALIVAASEQPEYAGKTFGVISLVGQDQAVWIDRLLRQHLEPLEYERRRLRCGNPAQFQGDERDVVWLSMVHGPAAGPLALMGEGPHGMYKKRYNVAASRARDQLWVVYSLDPYTDLKPGDMRRELLEFALDPGAAKRELDSATARAESDFERQVLARLVSAGYRVKPQHEVAYYRIDIVVEGDGKRLAVECDGDQYYHTSEQIASDLERQAILERLGWQFVRIRGSLFFRDPERALAPVFDRLRELEIPPEVKSPPLTTGDSDDSELLQRVIRRARELRAEWEDDRAYSLIPRLGLPSAGPAPSSSSPEPAAELQATGQEASTEPQALESEWPSSPAAAPPLEADNGSKPLKVHEPASSKITDDELHEQVLEGCVRTLAASSEMTAEELAKQVGKLVPGVDRSLVNKILFHFGRDTVVHDPTTRKYRLKDPAPNSDAQPATPADPRHQEYETVVKQRWKAGGIVVVPAFAQWQAIVRDQGHRRGFNIYIMYGAESKPRRVERTKRGALWEEARQQAGRLIVVAASGDGS
jgi:very-short-patch-repair endonuclease